MARLDSVSLVVLPVAFCSHLQYFYCSLCSLVEYKTGEETEYRWTYNPI